MKLRTQWLPKRPPALSTSIGCCHFPGTVKLQKKCESVRHSMYSHSRKQLTYLKPSAPNDVYISRTTQLTTRRCILNIYSTNILTEYFKHAAHSPLFFFSLSSICRLFHNAIFFGSCNIHILNTECAKILEKIPATKGLTIYAEGSANSNSADTYIYQLELLLIQSETER